MSENFLEEKQRQRAPSQKSLETRSRIMDAAEHLFARGGFDGTSIRDIAKEAEVQVALVNHHGGSKEALFWRVVARRADILNAARLEALQACLRTGKASLPDILDSFFAPLLHLSEQGDPQWRSYARLVAFVSADVRWKELAAVCFDPVAQKFVDEIRALYPETARQAVASGFVYSVAALLALMTSQWRMAALGDARANENHRREELVAFCAAGIDACVARTQN